MILAIDPGETMGLVWIEYGKLIGSRQVSVVSMNKQVDYSLLERTLRGSLVPAVDLIVIEDYRVYSSKAQMHVGARLTTAELIGAIEFYAAQREIKIIRLTASLKGRWPKARLLRFYEVDFLSVPKPHALDAWILGLTYLELYKDWSPLC